MKVFTEIWQRCENDFAWWMYGIIQNAFNIWQRCENDLIGQLTFFWLFLFPFHFLSWSALLYLVHLRSSLIYNIVSFLFLFLLSFSCWQGLACREIALDNYYSASHLVWILCTWDDTQTHTWTIIHCKKGFSHFFSYFFAIIIIGIIIKCVIMKDAVNSPKMHKYDVKLIWLLS